MLTQGNGSHLKGELNMSELKFYNTKIENQILVETLGGKSLLQAPDVITFLASGLVEASALLSYYILKVI